LEKEKMMSSSVLDLLAEAFSEAQDQLLAISALSQITAQQFDLEQLLPILVKQAKQILNAEAVFMMVDINNQPPLLVDFPINYFNPKEIVPLINAAHESLDAFQVIRIMDSAPIYILDQKIRGTGQIKLGFQIDTPKTALSPTLNLAQTITDQAKIQIENSFLHEELITQAKLQAEMEAARQMQASLLPESIPPSTETGLDMAIHFQPASKVGGDFYDLISQPHSGAIFAVGDISGKGIPAALLMSMTLNALRNGVRFIENPTPKKILAQVNQNMYDDFTRAGGFATVFIGSYDAHKGELSYGNAGHSPVIFCPANGDPRLLVADGTALGILPESLCESQILNFRPGDILVVGTDGFSEAENPLREMFGYNKLLHLVEELRHSSAQAIKDGFVKAINQFSSGYLQSDDQTLLVIKVNEIKEINHGNE